MKNENSLRSIQNDADSNLQGDSFEILMNDVESRDMPSISTSGWEITSILAILFMLMGILYKHMLQ
jgi:hypothetical protein